MKRILALLAAGLLVGNVAHAQLDTAALEQAMANPDRPQAEKDRDPNRQAPAVLSFLGLEEGMTVIDLIASAGWYTEVLSYAVGDSGHVYMQNQNPLPGFLQNSVDVIEDKLARLSNVEHWQNPITDIPEGSVDFALTALNFHDIHNPNPEAAQGFLAQVATVLRPGGIFGVIDHEGSPGADNVALHRISQDDLVAALTQSGDFELVETSDVLDNPADDHTVGPFDPSLARNTDRIVVKLVRR